MAKHLGNTPAICRRCYIHPAIFEGFVDGTLLPALKQRTEAYLADNIDGLSAEEAAVTAFLRLRLEEIGRTPRERLHSQLQATLERDAPQLVKNG